MLIGVRAHDFGVLPPESLARAIQGSGAACVQLALAKALSGVPSLPSELGLSGAHAIRDAFARHGLSIAILGCYINPVHPDDDEREAALSRFEDHLNHAAAFGCRIVGTESGSAAPNCSFHPDTASETFFKRLVTSLSRLVRHAESLGPNGPIIGVEPVADIHTLSSPDRTRRLLSLIDSAAIGIIFDPTNLVPQEGGPSASFLDDCFAAFGEKIVAIHAKDYRMLHSNKGALVKSQALPAGTGEMDWAGLFRRLKASGHAEVPILLENAGPAEVPAAIAALRSAWKESA